MLASRMSGVTIIFVPISAATSSVPASTINHKRTSLPRFGSDEDVGLFNPQLLDKLLDCQIGLAPCRESRPDRGPGYVRHR